MRSRIRTQNHREFQYELIPSPDYTLKFRNNTQHRPNLTGTPRIGTFELPLLRIGPNILERLKISTFSLPPTRTQPFLRAPFQDRHFLKNHPKIITIPAPPTQHRSRQKNLHTFSPSKEFQVVALSNAIQFVPALQGGRRSPGGAEAAQQQQRGVVELSPHQMRHGRARRRRCMQHWEN